MAQLGDSAAFLAAGGYHHHLGAEHLGEPRRLTAAGRHGGAAPRNDRAAGRRRPRPRAGTAGAGHAVESAEHGPAVSDPSGNRMVLATE